MRDYAFISYTKADEDFANWLSTEFKTMGVNHWLDKNELLPGDSIIDRLELAIEKANYFLIILSSRSIQSSWVKRELKAAILLENEKKSNFIIPIVIDNCKLPLFIRNTLFVDFRDNYNNERSLQLLLKTIDARKDEVLIDEDEYKSKLFEELISPLAGDDLWFSNFKDWELNKLWLNAIELNSYQGSFCDFFLTFLVMGSNIENQDFGSYVTVLIFSKEIVSNNLVNESLLELLSEIINDENISIDYRTVFLRTLYDRFGKIKSRRLRLHLLPDLFRKNKTNNLANHLIDKAFSETDYDMLNSLWKIGDAVYKEQILEYISSNFDIFLSQKDIESYSLETDLVFLQNIVNSRKIYRRKIEISKSDFQWSLIGGFESLKYLRLFEVATVESELDLRYIEFMSDFISGENILTALSNYGKKIIFNFLKEIIASPNVSVIVGSLALNQIWASGNISMLKVFNEFPRCFIKNKSAARFGNFSLIKSLIEGAENNKVCMFILCDLLELFPETPFRSAVYWELKKVRSESKQFKSLMKYLEGKASLYNLRKIIYGK